MIHVEVVRNAHKQISEIVIDGHADFADRGYDIVCAAVSSLAINIVNAVEVLLSLPLDPVDVGEEGFMWIRVPEALEADTSEKLQLLLETLALSLKGIAAQYDLYVRYTEEPSESV